MNPDMITRQQSTSMEPHLLPKPLPANEQSIVERFRKLTRRLGASDVTSTRWTNEFATRYTETQRHYHTLSHISAMFDCLKRKQIDVVENDTLALAMFFHDWIYDPTRQDNEIESMRRFDEFAADVHLQLEVRTLVNQYIECTITHTVPADEKADSEDSDLRLFLDADMEVLSRSPEDYRLYTQQIREEYQHYANTDYCQGRSIVLKAFLKKDQVYLSSAFAHCELAARRNIAAEIIVLQEGLLPAD